MERIIENVTPQKRLDIEIKNVCAYARVSSGKDAMLHSLSTQVSYYQDYIQSHKGWRFCGVYADEAITGTKGLRPKLREMLRECENGNEGYRTCTGGLWNHCGIRLKEIVKEVLIKADNFYLYCVKNLDNTGLYYLRLLPCLNVKFSRFNCRHPNVVSNKYK